jgi:hypothetical protein
VRFFRNRTATRNAEKSSQVAQTDTKKGSNNSKNSESNNSDSHSSKTDSSDEVVIPSGVAEGNDSDETSTVPAAGMGINTLGVAFALCAVTYGAVFLKTKHDAVSA